MLFFRLNDLPCHSSFGHGARSAGVLSRPGPVGPSDRCEQ